MSEYNKPCSDIQALADLRQFGWKPRSKRADDWRMVQMSLRRRVSIVGLPNIIGWLLATDGVAAVLMLLDGKTLFDTHINWLIPEKDISATAFRSAVKSKGETEPNLELVNHYANKYCKI